MAHSPHQARLEAAIARAHRAVFDAKVNAGALGQQELADDLDNLLIFLTWCGTEQLRKKPSKGLRRPLPVSVRRSE